MAAGVGVFFFDGGGEHADGAKEEVAVFLGSLLQAGDEALDVIGHVIESFGKLADFRGATHGRALMEFAAADGARGGGQGTDGRTDADGEEIAEYQRGGGDHE